ncbi:hypothetical protein J7E93_01285 [Streptomyces sp. ISL-36]|uniref:phospholipase D-like domain-containing protein n=1 Tax=Streptomyces sp. ISL-36 TaxID=2819182 RepID=UPI001BED3B27|nr:phospholipase D-like domain-containing protein [Streptomyces sp. ISL-36]MBT2438780.1 hypothetical protein [Streptomyces sp. ISL-36]
MDHARTPRPERTAHHVGYTPRGQCPPRDHLLDLQLPAQLGALDVPSTTEVAAHLAPAEVWRTKEFDGGYVRNHAKFLAIDHHLLLVTSANFSWSAENNNVEFGILIDNPSLTEAVERELRMAEGALYERIS